MFLGLDIGTSFIKLIVLNGDGEIAYSKSLPYPTVSWQKSDKDSNKFNTSNVLPILTTFVEIIHSIPPLLSSNIVSLSMCCQQHGCVLWKPELRFLNLNKISTNKSDVKTNSAHGWKSCFDKYCSHFYNWEDVRSQSIMEELPKSPKIQNHIYPGFGCATLYWLAKGNEPNLKQVEDYSYAGTIGDLITWLLCNWKDNNEKNHDPVIEPIMSNQNAVSWGYYDSVRNEWDKDTLQTVSFPIYLLPGTAEPGHIVGNLKSNFYNISQGTPVNVCLGDTPCAAYAAYSHYKNRAVINIGTSAQVSFVLPKGFQPSYIVDISKDDTTKNNALEYIPFFDNHYLAIAASMNGGNVICAFVDMIISWMKDLGLNINKDCIWERLRNINPSLESDFDSNLLHIQPIIIPERSDTKQAYVTNITLNNLNFDNVFQSICKGLIRNLHNMMPPSNFQPDITGMLGTGNALLSIPMLSHYVRMFYEMDLTMFKINYDAAYGACLAAFHKFKFTI